jgi:hypothetical protein
MLTSATMILAFWLQFGTNMFQRTPPPQVLWWLGIGTIGASMLLALTIWGRRRVPTLA